MLKIKVGLTKNPRFEPLIDGTVKSAKLHLDTVVTTPPELFSVISRTMSLMSLKCRFPSISSRANKPKAIRWDWAALPIFPAKAFVWLGFYVNTAAGIAGLADFRGKTHRRARLCHDRRPLV